MLWNKKHKTTGKTFALRENIRSKILRKESGERKFMFVFYTNIIFSSSVILQQLRPQLKFVLDKFLRNLWNSAEIIIVRHKLYSENLNGIMKYKIIIGGNQ